MKKPNLLIILSDELRRDALGCYGDPNVRTPHLDTLATRGVRFAQACSSSPVCVPYRFTFLTGEPAHSRMVPVIGWRMSPAERTLADYFNDAGYDTAYVGKWHLYGDHIVSWAISGERGRLTPVPRAHQGRWRKWLGFELCNAPFDSVYFEDDDPVPRKLVGYQTDALTTLTLDHLGKGWDRSKPFCCVLSVEPPHFPIQAPADYEARWKDRPLSLPPNFAVRPTDERHPHGTDFTPEQRAQQEDTWRRYYAMIENLDDNVGRITAFLARQGLLEDTIIVFTSDHGETAGCHGMGFGYKCWHYEHSSGVPLIACGPGLSAGVVIPDPVCTEDLLPTFLGVTGHVAPPALPGTDLSSLMQGATPALSRPGVMLELDHDHLKGGEWFPVQWRAFRSAHYKYAVLGDACGADPWHFFNLEKDPGELHNLIADPAYAGLVAQHHRWLRDEMVRTGDHYVLNPAFGIPGLNQWKPEAG